MQRQKKQASIEDLPLVAIELGSGSVRAMAAELIDTDTLRILGYEESSKFAYMDRGLITNTSNAGYMIKEVLTLLANRIHVDNLPTAFVLVGGRGMFIQKVISHRNQARPIVVSDKTLKGMEDECREKLEQGGENTILALIPSYFVLDGKEQDGKPEPSQRAMYVEGHYIAFVGKKELKHKVTDSFDRACKSIEETFVRPDALLSAINSEDSSILTNGCAVLDMGAETTTLSLYKGNTYLTTKVVSLGSNHITQLIEQQGILPHLAEQLKVRYGWAKQSLVTDNRRMRIPATAEVGGELVWTTRELAALIEQKLDEIMDPLITTLHDYAKEIHCLYLTGAGSMIQGMEEYIQKKTQVKVLYGSHAALLEKNTNDEYFSPKYTSLVGALILGADYRQRHPNEDVKPTKIKQRLEEKLLQLFTDQQY